MMRRSIVIGMAAALALMTAACGERPQVVQYKQGSYQGKTDQLPFAGAPWNGDKQQWATALKTRNESQNEYKRTH